uniref:Peptidase A1 domain-containing protein n=1 Tax=Aegilops tauschii subsp. strangulata TaxID=200361 RepID=A0A453F0D9_AEGTS
PVQTQSLLATPLSPDRVSAPSELARDDDTNVFAAAEDAVAGTVRFRVVHRDDFSKNATAAELLAHRLERDEKRAARLSAAAGAANGTRRGGGGVVAPVVSGLAQGSGEYFTKIGVGTPATPALMVLDTGSDVVWLQCAPCRRCYEQSGQVFDPRRSRSYGAVGCAAPLCRRLDSGGCDLRRSACLYQVAYGDGSVTAGDFATETLTFAGGARVARVALGCGHDNEGLFVAAAGLLGLGRGSLSFPTQISRRYGRSFSYCLVDQPSDGDVLLRAAHRYQRGRRARPWRGELRPPSRPVVGAWWRHRGLWHVRDPARPRGLLGSARRIPRGRRWAPALSRRVLPVRHVLRPERAQGGEGADRVDALRRWRGGGSAPGELPDPGGLERDVLLRVRGHGRRRVHHRQHTAAGLPGGVRRRRPARRLRAQGLL